MRGACFVGADNQFSAFFRAGQPGMRERWCLCVTSGQTASCSRVTVDDPTIVLMVGPP
jgi:hypothetical protein